MKPIAINNMHDVRIEANSAMSALFTAGGGSLLDGAEHAAEHIENLYMGTCHLVDEITISKANLKYRLEKQKHSLTNTLKEEFKVESIERNMIESLEHVLQNANNKFGIDSNAINEIMSDMNGHMLSSRR